MNITLFPSALSGSLPAVTSKSYGHRAMICAALADKPTSLSMNLLSADIAATADCLAALGASIDTSANGIVKVSPVHLTEGTPLLDCNESGSTLRFLLPVTAALADRAFFFGRGRLPERPLSPLITAMTSHGCRFEGECLPFTVEGRLESGRFLLPGNISSQFITGILLALPLVRGGEVVLTTPLESAGYLDMTLDVMRRFGVAVLRTPEGFSVSQDAAYRSPESFLVEGDWSNSAFWLAAGALSEKILLTGLNLCSAQGDRAIVKLLRAFGAEVSECENEVSVSRGSSALSPQVIDASNIPDLVPVLASVALNAKGETIIKNAGRLRLKESDRLRCIADGLQSLGGNVVETADGLIITGSGRLKGGHADGCNDHRIVMALAVASLLCDGPVEISGAEAVSKSYPGFFEDFAHLGGKYERSGK